MRSQVSTQIQKCELQNSLHIHVSLKFSPLPIAFFSIVYQLILDKAELCTMILIDTSTVTTELSSLKCLHAVLGTHYDNDHSLSFKLQIYGAHFYGNEKLHSTQFSPYYVYVIFKNNKRPSEISKFLLSSLFSGWDLSSLCCEMTTSF